MRYQCISPSRSVEVDRFSGWSMLNASFSAVLAVLNCPASCRSIDSGRWSLVYIVGLVGEIWATSWAMRMCWRHHRPEEGLGRNT